MSVWRYKAVPLSGSAPASDGLRSGELAADSAAEVRASLRRIGLQVVELRPAKRALSIDTASWLAPLHASGHRHLRTRRGPRRGEMFDSLATMLDAGVPLVEAVSTVAGGTGGRSSSSRRMLAELLESLRDGSALSEAMASHPSWFEPAEIAMVESGQVTGELAGVLHGLAQRQQRSGELTGKLAAALTYPAIVAVVGLGVVVFLSTKTLPDLTAILRDADVRIPALTAGVMAFGQSMVALGPWILVGVIGLLLAGLVLGGRMRRKGIAAPAWAQSLAPRVLRQAAVAEAMLGLSEMIGAGVPVVEGLRVLAPTFVGVFRGELGRLLTEAADGVERGESVSGSLPEGRWFDAELRRLIEIGESSGELPDVLERVATRQQRVAKRAIDRLASLLEPAVILALAFLVGLVVLSAVLPLVRLQEVL